MTTLFVSHSPENELVLQSLTADLTKLGYNLLTDEKMNGDRVWWESILEQIRACDALVFLMSNESLASNTCTQEYLYASSLGKPVIPVLLSDAIAIDLLPPALTAIPPIRYVDAASATKMLEQTLRHAPKAPMLPDPLPPEPDAPKAFYMGLRGQIEKDEELTYSEQSRILNEVKQGIQEQSSEVSARALLDKLDQRPDLFVAIADEISSLKATEFRDFRYLQVVPVEAPAESSAEIQLPTPPLAEPPVRTTVGAPPPQPPQQTTSKESSGPHYLRNAAIGAIVGEVLRNVLDFSGFNPLGIAGAITGLLASGNPRVVLIAIMTSILAVGIDFSSNYPNTNQSTASLGLVLGAIAAYIFLRPSKPKS